MNTKHLNRAHVVFLMTFLIVFVGSVVRAAGCQPVISAHTGSPFKSTSYLGKALACEFEKVRSIRSH